MTQPIRISLWFDNQLEEAIGFYTAIFPNSRVVERSFMPEGGPAPAGTMISASFVLNGIEFIGINGGPMFKFTEAISLAIEANTQEEIDYYWSRLTEGGEESQCGWLKDRYGVSWQVVPVVLSQLLADPDPGRASRAMAAMLQMQKLDIAALIAAADAEPLATTS